MNATATALRQRGAVSLLSRGSAAVVRQSQSHPQQLWCYYSRSGSNPHGPPLSQAGFHTIALGTGTGRTRNNTTDDDPQEKDPRRLLSERGYHASARQDRTAVTVILGLGALSATSYAAATAVRAWNEYQASLPNEPPPPEPAAGDDEASQQSSNQQQQETTNSSSSSEQAASGPRGNIFKEWFGVGVGAKYYEGGFEDVMTRREAALILGVRESSDPKRIKDAHRKLLILNHPDTGGSTYLSGKINEAKEMLLKGRMKQRG